MTTEEKIKTAKGLLINNLPTDADVPEVERFVDLIIEIAIEKMLDMPITDIQSLEGNTVGMNLDDIFLKASFS